MPDNKIDQNLAMAINSAAKMARKGYSLSFCVKKACEQTGYKTKSHVDKGMREVLGQEFLIQRAAEAKRAHTAINLKPGDPGYGRDFTKLAKDRKLHKNHFESI